MTYALCSAQPSVPLLLVRVFVAEVVAIGGFAGSGSQGSCKRAGEQVAAKVAAATKNISVRAHVNKFVAGFAHQSSEVRHAIDVHVVVQHVQTRWVGYTGKDLAAIELARLPRKDPKAIFVKGCIGMWINSTVPKTAKQFRYGKKPNRFQQRDRLLKARKSLGGSNNGDQDSETCQTQTVCVPNEDIGTRTLLRSPI
jgi:hypothetical protein